MKWGLKKREPSDYGIDSLRKEMSDLFDNFFSVGESRLFDHDWSPKVDIEEDDKAIHVKAEIPGIDEKNLNVSVENNMLVIQGEKREEKEKKDKKTILSERSFGSFYRSFSLPEGVLADRISATFRKGMLSVEIPKGESKNPNRISIDVK